MRTAAVGLAPALVVVLFFRFRIAPSNELVSASALEARATVERLLDPDRYLYIGTNFVEMMLSFGSNGLVSAGWLLLTYLVCVGVNRRNLQLTAVRTGLLAFPLILGGHALVYLTAPVDMQRLLDGSIERVFLQLWPGFLLLFFMIARSLEEASPVAATAVASTTEERIHEVGQAA